ncbi:hypothetical protein BDN70DRAFT_771691, partial [Pholiota conissans]
AIFELNAECSTPISNEADLMNELRLLTLGQYFADIFQDRINQYGVPLQFPSLTFNACDAFCGELKQPFETRDADDLDNPFYWSFFLAAPLVSLTDGQYTEKKWCGNEEVCNLANGVGAVVMAFLHATLIHSRGEILFSDVQGRIFANKQVVLFDPQAHTKDGSSGHWDRGRAMIETFMARHECNRYCLMLEL